MNSKKDYSAYRPMINFTALGGFVLKHPGFALFSFYGTTALAGFIYLLTFYKRFDFNAIAYLEISDILVAGVKDPTVMLMVFLSFLLIPFMWAITYISAPFNAWLDQKVSGTRLRFLVPLFMFRTTKQFWSVTVALTLLYFALFISFHSNNKATNILEKSKAGIELQADGIDSTDELSLLGTSVNYIFVYEKNKKQVFVLPLENVSKIGIKPVIKKDGEPDEKEKAESKTVTDPKVAEKDNAQEK